MPESNKISSLELHSLRYCFEEMMRKPPYHFHNFRRTSDDGYEVGMLQLAWFTLGCGYLAGKACRDGS